MVNNLARAGCDSGPVAFARLKYVSIQHSSWACLSSFPTPSHILAPFIHIPFPFPFPFVSFVSFRVRGMILNARACLRSPPLRFASMTSLAMNQQPASAAVVGEPSSSRSLSVQAASSSGPRLRFTKLSPGLHVYRPPQRTADDGAQAPNGPASQASSSASTPLTGITSPRVVLMMAWMDAPLRVVTKYAIPWTERFPDALIAIKMSTGKGYISSRAAQVEEMRPLVALLREEAIAEAQEEGEETAKAANTTEKELDEISSTLDGAHKGSAKESKTARSHGIVIHSFSDGGAGNLALLLRLLGRSSLSSSTCPSTTSSASAPAIIPRAHIMDSSPGRTDPNSASLAFTIPLAKRNKLLFRLSRAMVYIFLRALFFIFRIIGRRPRGERVRAQLNDPGLWSNARAGARTRARAGAETESNETNAKLPPRLYLYSRADKLIPWEAVEEHAREAATLQGLSAPKPVLMDPLDAQPARPTQSQSEKQSGQQQSGTSSPRVELHRWEEAAHCDLGRADLKGYWSTVDGFLSRVLQEI